MSQPQTHSVGQYTNDGQRLTTISGLGRNAGTWDHAHTKATAQRHARLLRKEDPRHDYRAEEN